MRQTINKDDSAVEAQAVKKLVKACKSVYAMFVYLWSTNQDLLLAADHQDERVTRFKDHYVDAKILNLEIIEKRNQKTEDKTQEKFNKQNDILLNRWLKSFVTADLELFAERVVKQRSSTKKASSAFALSFKLSSSFTSLAQAKIVQSAKKQRKQIQKSNDSVCYEHAWTDQGPDSAMPSLNLAHPFEPSPALLPVCSALSSFTPFIILLGKHIWPITSHLYRA